MNLMAELKRSALVPCSRVERDPVQINCDNKLKLSCLVG